MDKKIVLKLYDFTMNRKGVYNFIKFIINVSAYIFFLMFGIMTITLAVTGNEKIFKFFFVTVFIIFFNMFVRKLIGRKRPFDVLKINSIVSHKSAGSFPSNHSASAMAIAFAFFYVSRTCGAIIFVMAVVTGMARVFAGLHYLSDVLAGFFVGIFLGYIGFFCV
ncbi:MAG: phosphatase PAP2 family protein [Clostridiales bacterium]|jgi:undecaprenyl-diphosphatase|nr:phosphatase PAP2 family protein [Clostridiales bacterium]